MALVNCPECGAQVSSTAKQCVHCRCKYSVCPECGGVFAGDVKICPACGYSIDGKTKSNKTGVTGGGNSVIAAVCCGIFLTQNADMWLRIKLTGEEFVFQYAALIPAVIFIGLYYVAAFVGTKIFNKRKTAWLESIGL